MDAFRVILVFFYVIIAYSDSNRDFEDWILTIVTMFSWNRVLSYYRIFKETRYLIRMILEICYDMFAFVSILLTTIFALSLIFYISYEGEVELRDSILEIYLLNYGEFNDEYDKTL
jgi:hypothetical protein|mmetsp:Transcript_35975/g.6464  ORF Transcript_35975/g.6464 Transcript_35975/m.6464 type:complete len:116 (-) Transcript_35975:389-736(-)